MLAQQHIVEPASTSTSAAAGRAMRAFFEKLTATLTVRIFSAPVAFQIAEFTKAGN